MQNQRKVKEQNDLLRKKMFVLTALEDKIKYLVKKLEELSDKTATTADSNSIIENYGSLIQQIRELLSIYNKVRGNAEADPGEMVTPLKEQVDMLEKQYLSNAEIIVQGSNSITDLKSELMVLSNIL